MMRFPGVPAYTLALLSLGGPAPIPSVGHSTSLAAPEIIIFHGGPLTSPVTVASWTENHALLLSMEPSEGLTPRWPPTPTRPVIKLALFWGVQWRAYARSPSLLATLTPAQANQTGEFLPAVPGARARIRVGFIDGPVSDSGLAVLRRHRIPTRIE
jgi:hypothetical protein